jgi:hypothetical protein
VRVEEFDAIAETVPYRRKGMFYSEVFAFLQACERRSVTHLIESGVKFGMSTKLLSSAWHGEIIAIDKDAAAFDATYPGVRMVQGDSRVLIPRLLKEASLAHRRVGVLIDGPKGAAALALKDLCLRTEACYVVGVHDMPSTEGHCHTHDPAWASVREALDKHLPDEWRRKYPMGSGLALWEKKQ